MRKSSDSDVLELELIRRDIPYVKYGGLKFLEAAHIKDVLALLRFIDNPRNRLAGFRTLQLLPGVGPANAEQCLQLIEQSAGTLMAIHQFNAPAQALGDWPDFLALATSLSNATEWAGQMTQVRQWYEPHLERLHGAAHVRAGDLEQLEALATQHRTRESFLTELTLDPPQASSDEAGPPHLDEDFLILSTVHSAKGQEWDSVYTLNVVDGTFPNEFATESAAHIEEERRLLYVAMTRAKRNLHLISPLKFYIPQQKRLGAKHVYGGRSRFMTEHVLATFVSQAWPSKVDEASAKIPVQQIRIDAGARMRSMWSD
jgi:DNA helicase-2/ATP-dependent DNA helicase PcrA